MQSHSGVSPNYVALPAASNTSDYVHLHVRLFVPIQKAMERDVLHVSTVKRCSSFPSRGGGQVSSNAEIGTGQIMWERSRSKSVPQLTVQQPMSGIVWPHLHTHTHTHKQVVGYALLRVLPRSVRLVSWETLGRLDYDRIRLEKLVVWLRL
jgi:hypothetical protein